MKLSHGKYTIISILKRSGRGGVLTNISDGGETYIASYLKNNPGKNPMFKEENRAKFRGQNNPMKRPEVAEKVRQHNLGKKHSDEMRKKCSDRMKGKPSFNKGKKLTPEQLELCIIRNREISNKPERKLKFSAKMKGRRIEKYFIPVDMFSKQGILIKTFPSITDALIYIGKPIKSGNISMACKGKRANAFGYLWKYAS